MVGWLVVTALMMLLSFTLGAIVTLYVVEFTLKRSEMKLSPVMEEVEDEPVEEEEAPVEEESIPYRQRVSPELLDDEYPTEEV